MVTIRKWPYTRCERRRDPIEAAFLREFVPPPFGQGRLYASDAQVSAIFPLQRAHDNGLPVPSRVL